MGMGYGANYTDIVEEIFVQGQCRNEFNELKSLLDKNSIDWNRFAEIASYYDVNGELDVLTLDESQKEVKEAIVLLNKLTEEFEKKTSLSLCIGYHDNAIDGSRYDEVNGCFWSVGNVYCKTEAGKKYSDFIKRAFYVTFG